MNITTSAGGLYLVTESDIRMDSGFIERPYGDFPLGCYPSAPKFAVDMPLIEEDDWPALIRKKDAEKSWLFNIRDRGDNGNRIKSLNQGAFGYCWFHSGTSAVMLLRAAANQPCEYLSAFSGAATIKRGRNEGGWGAQGLDFIMERGIMPQRIWPQGDAGYQKYDKAENWAEAAKFRVTEGFIDLQAAQYDRKLSRKQVGSLLLSNIPVIGDYNWWGHSVCLMGLTILPNGKIGVIIWNSWGDEWGTAGVGVLDENKAWPDGATAPRVAMAA